MDKKMIDVKQDCVETVLLACIGSSDRQWPSTFNEKEIEALCLMSQTEK